MFENVVSQQGNRVLLRNRMELPIQLVDTSDTGCRYPVDIYSPQIIEFSLASRVFI